MRDSPPTFLAFWIVVITVLGWPAMLPVGTPGKVVGEVLWLLLIGGGGWFFRQRLLKNRPHTHRHRGRHCCDDRTPEEEHADLLAARKAAVQARAASQRLYSTRR